MKLFSPMGVRWIGLGWIDLSSKIDALGPNNIHETDRSKLIYSEIRFAF